MGLHDSVDPSTLEEPSLVFRTSEVREVKCLLSLSYKPGSSLLVSPGVQKVKDQVPTRATWRWRTKGLFS